MDKIWHSNPTLSLVLPVDAKRVVIVARAIICRHLSDEVHPVECLEEDKESSFVEPLWLD